MHESVNSIALYAARSGWDRDVSQTAPGRVDGGLHDVFMQKAASVACRWRLALPMYIRQQRAMPRTRNRCARFRCDVYCHHNRLSLCIGDIVLFQSSRIHDGKSN